MGPYLTMWGARTRPSRTILPLPLSLEPAATPEPKQASPGFRESLGSVETLNKGATAPICWSPLGSATARPGDVAPGGVGTPTGQGLSSLLGLFHLCDLGGEEPVTFYPPLPRSIHPPHPSASSHPFAQHSARRCPAGSGLWATTLPPHETPPGRTCFLGWFNLICNKKPNN